MTVQAAIAAELPFLRSEAVARMTSRATIRRKMGRTAQDEDTGVESPVWAVVHESLPFRLAGSSNGDGGSQTVNIDGIEYEQATAVGHLPASTVDLADSDYIEVVSGEWAGSVYSVVKATRKDQATARRVPIAEQARPSEWG